MTPVWQSFKTLFERVQSANRRRRYWAQARRAERIKASLDIEELGELRPRQLTESLGLDVATVQQFLAEAEADRTCLVEVERRRAELVDAGLIGHTGPFDCITLYAVIRAIRPDVVVETGVSFGASTAYILRALECNGRGRLYSIDLPMGDTGARFGQGFLVLDQLRGRWQLIKGNSHDELPRLLAQLGKIGLFHHDSWHSYEFMTWEYGTAWPHLVPTGVITSHDVLRHKAFEDFCEKHRKATRPFAIIRDVGVVRKR